VPAAATTTIGDPHRGHSGLGIAASTVDVGRDAEAGGEAAAGHGLTDCTATPAMGTDHRP
jgi:hypothetical protein